MVPPSFSGPKDRKQAKAPKVELLNFNFNPADPASEKIVERGHADSENESDDAIDYRH